MAGPGIFAPVSIAGKVLFDRDIVNLAPYDRLLDRAEFTIAADVSRAPNPGRHEIPSALESILGAFNIRQASALAEEMKYRKPDIYVHPEVQGVRMLGFNKTEEVFLQTGPTVELLRRQLKSMVVEQGHSTDRNYPVPICGR